MTGAEIATVIMSIGGLLGGGLSFTMTRANAAKSEAETERLSVTTANDVVVLVRREMRTLEVELQAQRDARVREREERDEEVAGLVAEITLLKGRVDTLHKWITDNTDQDPMSINGWPV